jgi:hypothetical protein
MQLVTDGAGWYQVNALGSVSVFCGPNCYANPFAMNIGLAYTQSGKNLTLSNGVWVESSGNNVLRADGSDNWHYALNANGKGSSAALLDKTTANLRGRVCPTSVYIDDTNKLASGRCLYYDEGLVWQTLHAAGTSQTVQSTMGLSSWNIDGTGNGTGSAWYEGNIKTCADKGMRLPTFYETSGYYSGGSNKPSDVSPPNINAANGVPAASSGAWTWTSTAYTSITGAYWLWSTSATLVNSFFDYSAVRCVLP